MKDEEMKMLLIPEKKCQLLGHMLIRQVYQMASDVFTEPVTWELIKQRNNKEM